MTVNRYSLGNPVDAASRFAWVARTLINVNLTESAVEARCTFTGELVNAIHAGGVILTGHGVALIDVDLT